MSVTTSSEIGVRPVRAGHPNRIATLAVTLTIMLAFLWIALQVIQHGYVRLDIAALQKGAAWIRGGWLSQLVLAFVSLVPDQPIRQLVLSLTSAVAAGLGLGMLYHLLRRNGWQVAGALLVVTALAANALVLHLVTAASLTIPLLVALAAIIPAIRQVETVGDVQSAISIGLIMPLLLLAGPATTPLILPLSIAVALADPDGRRDPRAFVAMVLVTVLPSIIVTIGIVGFTLQAGADVTTLLLPYFAAYRIGDLEHWRAGIAAFVVYAPVLVVPLLYCVLPGASERPHRWSALAVVALPAYLVAGGALFIWNVPVWAPPIALLATFGSWLASIRLTVRMRVAAVALLVLSAALSWAPLPFWHDADWQAALSATWRQVAHQPG